GGEEEVGKRLIALTVRAEPVEALPCFCAEEVKGRASTSSARTVDGSVDYGTRAASLAACRRSARAAASIWAKQPVQPPGPTVEQLWMPVRPTYSRLSARLAQLWLAGSVLGALRSSCGIR